jgi:uncharacterized protein YndB with AHSA1/START domain
MKALVVVTLLVSAVAQAQRPPAKGHAQHTDGAQYLATLPAEKRAVLEQKGLVVLSQKDGVVRAAVKFDRPRDEVFAAITQPSTQVGYLPHVTKSKTATATRDGEATDMEVSFLFVFRYRTQHWLYPEQHRMEWSLDPSGEDGLTDQEGFWQLYELDERTTVAEYATKVVAKGAFLNFLRGLGERGGVEEALAAFRAHATRAQVAQR